MLLTVKEVAAELHVNTNYVYKLVQVGLLPALKLGSLKVRREALEKFLSDYEGQNVDEKIKELGNELAENSDGNFKSTI